MIFALPKFKKLQQLTDDLNRVTRENLTGISVVRAYNAENYQASSKEFVFDAYSAEPVGYILKPVSRQKLAEALTRAIRHLIPKSIIIDTPSRTVSFHIRDITYIEIINKELQIHLQDGTVTKIYKSLSAVREILPKDIFVQCHRCYIVSLYAVRSIRRFEITLNNHEIIPVSKYSYRDVQEQLQQYAAKWF